MKLKDILKTYRESHGLSMRDFARKCGLSNAYISILESGIHPRTGKALTPTFHTLSKIATAMGMRVDDLFAMLNSDEMISLSNESDFTESEILIPEIAEVAAGFDKLPITDFEYDRFPIPTAYTRGYKPDDLFIIRVRGDSMYPMYQDGDRILSVRSSEAESGDVAIIQYGEYATIKRIEVVKDGLRLNPINPLYKPETVADGTTVRVIGLPILLLRELAKPKQTEPIES